MSWTIIDTHDTACAHVGSAGYREPKSGGAGSHELWVLDPHCELRTAPSGRSTDGFGGSATPTTACKPQIATVARGAQEGILISHMGERDR